MKMRCEVNWLFVRSSSCLQSNKGNQIWLYCFTVFSWVKNKYVYLACLFCPYVLVLSSPIDRQCRSQLSTISAGTPNPLPHYSINNLIEDILHTIEFSSFKINQFSWVNTVWLYILHIMHNALDRFGVVRMYQMCPSWVLLEMVYLNKIRLKQHYLVWCYINLIKLGYNSKIWIYK